MIATALVVAALLLGVERVAYIWISRRPHAFREVCEESFLRRAGGPVDVLTVAFYVFKAIQLAVFLGWCALFGQDTWFLPTAGGFALAGGAALIVAGQALNFSVFRRLGRIGVFYGNRLGHEIPWQRGFPFSMLRHPQYVGVLMSVWGFFLVMRFPNPDWIALPLLQSLYYAAGAGLER